MANEELKQVNGYSVPAEGEKVAFLSLGKECTCTGDGKHTCYQLIGAHPGGPKKAASKKKPAAKKKPAKKKGAK